MCWPRGWADAVVVEEHAGPPPMPDVPRNGIRGSARRKAQARKSNTANEGTGSQSCTQDQITVEAFTSYLEQVRYAWHHIQDSTA